MKTIYEQTIEFFEDTHTYLVDGIITPSVTTIIKQIFPDKYKGISDAVLKRKAEFGTKGHSIIEMIGKNKMNKQEALNKISELYQMKEINQDMFISLREYVRLCEKYDIDVLANEVIVAYGNKYAGTLDMIANVKGKKSLIDIKFTAELDEEYLSWQEGMYDLASPETFEEYYCLWLPKGKVGKLAPIKTKTKEEILNMLEKVGNDDD